MAYGAVTRAKALKRCCPRKRRGRNSASAGGPEPGPGKDRREPRAMLPPLCPGGIRMEFIDHPRCCGDPSARTVPTSRPSARVRSNRHSAVARFLRCEGGSIPIVTAFHKALGADGLLIGWGRGRRRCGTAPTKSFPSPTSTAESRHSVPAEKQLSRLPGDRPFKPRPASGLPPSTLSAARPPASAVSSTKTRSSTAATQDAAGEAATYRERKPPRRYGPLAGAADPSRYGSIPGKDHSHLASSPVLAAERDRATECLVSAARAPCLFAEAVCQSRRWYDANGASIISMFSPSNDHWESHASTANLSVENADVGP